MMWCSSINKTLQSMASCCGIRAIKHVLENNQHQADNRSATSSHHLKQHDTLCFIPHQNTEVIKCVFL